MQPHSISALAVARYYYGFDKKLPSTGEVIVRYKKWDGTRWINEDKYHWISKVELMGSNESNSGLNVEVKASDGITCRISIKRSSSGAFGKESENLTATHSPSHLAGLEEVYKVGKSIRGFHRRSRKYRDFSGSSNHAEFFELECDIRQIKILMNRKTTSFVKQKYIVQFKPKH